MRDQILESFNHRDFSLMVVGNKYDLCTDACRQSQVSARIEVRDGSVYGTIVNKFACFGMLCTTGAHISLLCLKAGIATVRVSYFEVSKTLS